MTATTPHSIRVWRCVRVCIIGFASMCLCLCLCKVCIHIWLWIECDDAVTWPINHKFNVLWNGITNSTHFYAHNQWYMTFHFMNWIWLFAFYFSLFSVLSVFFSSFFRFERVGTINWILWKRVNTLIVIMAVRWMHFAQFSARAIENIMLHALNSFAFVFYLFKHSSTATGRINWAWLRWYTTE